MNSLNWFFISQFLDIGFIIEQFVTIRMLVIRLFSLVWDFIFEVREEDILHNIINFLIFFTRFIEIVIKGKNIEQKMINLINYSTRVQK